MLLPHPLDKSWDGCQQYGSRSGRKQQHRKVISRKIGALAPLHAEVVTVSEIVTDESGEAIQGVTVVISGAGTVTDIDGSYTISVPEEAELTFSYVGFVSRTLSVGNQSQMNLVVLMDTTSLEEVV